MRGHQRSERNTPTTPQMMALIFLLRRMDCQICVVSRGSYRATLPTETNSPSPGSRPASGIPAEHGFRMIRHTQAQQDQQSIRRPSTLAKGRVWCNPWVMRLMWRVQVGLRLVYVGPEGLAPGQVIVRTSGLEPPVFPVKGFATS